ncbi:MAG: noncanonical pyrimidine nucleotidase, YjjG family [Bacteroidetes bacterium 43-16]|nr:MAG: noncanonical pyrimidine nucleotidase, YjjG family [Bacteroidetes bacterium 43-16]
MNRYQTIFFDLDHTLWDFEANSKVTLAHIYQSFELSNKGIEDFEPFYQVYRAHNERLWDRYRKGFMKREELKWKRMWLTLLDFKMPNEALAKDMAAVFIEMLPRQQRLFPYAIEVLDYCKAKQYELNLITNGFEDTQWKKLEAAGLNSYFAHVVTSEKSNSVKPEPEIFEYALGLSQVSADNALMIGDNLEVDIAGAQGAGIDQVYFNPGKLDHGHRPTFEIACLSELMDIL